MSTKYSFFITLFQFSVDFGNVEGNLSFVEEKLKNYKFPNKNSTNIIFLPELFATGYDIDIIKKQASSLKESRIISFLSSLAISNNSYIYTSIPEKENENIFNTAIIINNRGELLYKYRKIHLFIPLGELKVFKPGKEVVNCKLPWGNTGISICYDLRFPEIFVKQRNDGARFFFICAEWPIKRINHWITLIQSRAIEHQSFVVAINRIGTDKSGTYGGNSIIVSPDGDLIMNLGSKESIVSKEINTGILFSVKKLFDVQKEQRLNI